MSAFWKRLLTIIPQRQDYQQSLKNAQAARLSYYQSLGTDVFEPRSPLETPIISNSPPWPAQQAWRKIQNATNTILVTDGLSNPFPKRSFNNGFDIEILVETTDPILENYESTWLFHVLFQVSQNAAYHAGFRKLIDQHQIGMLEIASIPELQPFQNETGNIGIFLGLHTGLKHDTVEYVSAHNDQTTNALIVSAKLLTLPEFNYARHNEAIGYQLLRERFLSQNSNHISSLKRESVI